MNYVTIAGGGPTFNLVLEAENRSEANNEIRLLCDTSSGAVTIQLPPISDFRWGINGKIYIDDAGDMASVNNITVLADPSNTIDNNASYVISTSGAKAAIYISSLIEFAVLQSIGGGIIVPPAVTYTYAQLAARVAANLLVKGQRYIISDFATRHVIPNTVDVNVGAVEPIMLTAMSANTFNKSAQSTVFLQDILFYEFVDSSTAGGDKGRIYYRRDTEKNLATWYDWRNVIYRRWASGNFSYGGLVGTFRLNETVTGGTTGATARIVSDNGATLGLKLINGIFQSGEILTGGTSGASATLGAMGATDEDNTTDTGFSYSDKYTFGTISGVDFSEVEIGAITDYGIASVGCPSDKLNNIVFSTSGNYIKLGEDCFDCTIGAATENVSIGVAFTNNIIGDSFNSNILGYNIYSNIILSGFANNLVGNACFQNLIGANSASNKISDSFTQNYVSSGFNGNTIGNSFSSNSILDNFANNIIEGNFASNTIANSCYNNYFGAYFSTNRLGASFHYNTIGVGCSNNIIGVDCYRNKFSAECSGNTLGDTFTDNEIGFNSSSNTIAANFQRNTTGSSFTGNNIGANCIENSIGNRFEVNTIGAGMSQNVIGSVFQLNTIGSTFTANRIAGGFASNTIGDAFTANNINYPFSGNTATGNFQYNTLNAEVTATDFSAATFVYFSYTKTIAKNEAAALFLRYADAANADLNVAITA